ncbi:MAG: four helix bundle protein, partial [Oscillospiraceae bacterium]|nr:four helix bundle protein [Oscillospiraceae bacterium]
RIMITTRFENPADKDLLMDLINAQDLSGQYGIRKLQIAKKEAAETLYWLELLNGCDYVPEDLFRSLHHECRELLLMLTSSIKTSID